MVHFIVCIAYGKGVYFCEQYKKMNGGYFAGFIRRNSTEIVRKSCNPASNLFVQGGDLSQNSKAAAKEWQKRKIKLLSIPPHSADINPIENMFNLIDRKLKSDGIEQNITHETYEQFSVRAQNFLENYPIAEIDKIVDTKPERMHQIICRSNNNFLKIQIRSADQRIICKPKNYLQIEELFADRTLINR